MVKRKGSAAEEPKSKKKIKQTKTNTGKIKCSSPDTTFSTLFGPENLKDFFSKHWERQYLHIQRNDKDFYGDLFSLDSLKEIIDENDLEYETDINVCRYLNNEKEYLNETGKITLKEFEELLEEKKATFQFHQPQRFIVSENKKSLWELIGQLEGYFNSLVGANVYITPTHSQGLAPHCDDVEIFVLQLEGNKKWKLYKPKVELSRDYTEDLPQNGIGEPIAEITLKPGDLLYFPRGTIHQAETTSEGHSTHISISTYQQNTWGEFMQHTISQAIENAMDGDVIFRSGLPTNYLKFLGTGKNMSKYVEESTKENNIFNENDQDVKKFKEKIKVMFSKLVDHIDVDKAADAMCADFVSNRLPPFGHVITEDGNDSVPTLEDEIKVRYPEHVRVVYMDDDDDEEEGTNQSQMECSDSEDDGLPKENKKSTKRNSDTEDDEEDEDANPIEQGPHIRIIHSLNNDRETHMIGINLGGFSGTLKLPIHFASAVIKLLDARDFVKVKDLELDEDEDKVTLATTLFADDLIETKS